MEALFHAALRLLWLASAPQRKRVMRTPPTAHLRALFHSARNSINHVPCRSARRVFNYHNLRSLSSGYLLFGEVGACSFTCPTVVPIDNDKTCAVSVVAEKISQPLNPLDVRFHLGLLSHLLRNTAPEVGRETLHPLISQPPLGLLPPDCRSDVAVFT